MEFEEYYDHKFLVVKLVPEFIEANAAVQGGEPCLTGTRIPTVCASMTFEEGNYAESYNITKEQAFAAFCFEAGMEYQRNRKLRKRVRESIWESVKPTIEAIERRKADDSDLVEIQEET